MTPSDQHRSWPSDRPLRFNEVRFFAEYPVLTRVQLADFYGLSVSTFVRRMKNAGLHLPARPLYPEDVHQIFISLGSPPKCIQYYE